MENNIIKRKAELILKYMQDGMSDRERLELDDWVSASGENKAFFENLTESTQLKQALLDFAGNKTKTWEQIAALIAQQQPEDTSKNLLN
ncbi:hypothetical protein [Paraflavitalea speifideaquila]|uniref:hypothetical protein n=1 Tax=Paraflavitalea speifideaquila TaxID=3076558 RepID=UPI0028E566D1|nr:hypothetical protein [Paraflavitalea speifideiaquila]